MQTEIEECASEPCLNGGSCIDRFDGYTCLCKMGYTGVDCEKDIDECLVVSCSNNSYCINVIGGFLCDCHVGFEGRMCEEDVNECISQPCQNGASCFNSVGSFRSVRLLSVSSVFSSFNRLSIFYFPIMMPSRQLLWHLLLSDTATKRFYT